MPVWIKRFSAGPASAQGSVHSHSGWLLVWVDDMVADQAGECDVGLKSSTLTGTEDGPLESISRNNSMSPSSVARRSMQCALARSSRGQERAGMSGARGVGSGGRGDAMQERARKFRR